MQGTTPPGLVERPAAVSHPPKVLLIVGDDEMREMLTDALAKAGCEVTPHRLDPRYYPAELLGLLEKGRFDVVIPTNLGIPFVYVPDMVMLTRKFAKGAGIIVISGWMQDDFVEELTRTPRSAFLQAPVELPQLASKIRELAGKPAVKQPCLNVIFGDGKDNIVSELILEWLVHRYSGVLTVRGHRLCSGEEILRIASNELVNLFFINLTPLWNAGAPFRDQIEFARHLKRKHGKPIIMTTGFIEPDLQELAMAAGVDAYFVHPIQFEKLDAAVKNLLNIV